MNNFFKNVLGNDKVEKYSKGTNVPSLSEKPFCCHASSSLSIARHSSDFHPESPIWQMPMIREPSGWIQGTTLFEFIFCTSQDDPPIASTVLRNLLRERNNSGINKWKTRPVKKD